MSQARFVCAGVYRGRVYEIFTIKYDTDVDTYGDVMTKIATGLKDAAVNFEFEAMMEGFTDDGQDPTAG